MSNVFKLNIIAMFGNYCIMSKFGIVNLIDKLFITFGVFLLVFSWINFYFHNLWLSFLFGIVISFSIIYLINFFISKKNKKLALSKAENKEMEQLFYVFKLNPKIEKLKIIKQIIEKEIEKFTKNESKQSYDTVVEQKMPNEKNFENVNIKSKINNIKTSKITQNDKVELKNGILTYNFLNKKHLVVVATNYAVITQQDLINLLDEFVNLKFDEIDIICCGVQNVDTQIFVDKQINIIDKHALYTLFKQNNIFPNGKNIKLDATKPKFTTILKSIFAPNKARGYFLSGLVILFSSVVLPYHIYYLVFGSVLIMFSLACKLMRYNLS